MPPIARAFLRTAALLGAAAATACVDSKGRNDLSKVQAQSCMSCHNGSQHDDYGGPGIEDPHPIVGAERLQCTGCHGGNPNGTDKDSSHVPPPPQIGDRLQQQTDPRAFFNRLTLAGVDKMADYMVNGVTWRALDWLQFVQPGDLRVVTAGRACGRCHGGHAGVVSRSILATEAGFFSGSNYFMGADNAIPSHQGLYDDTAADLAWRAATDPNWSYDPQKVGLVDSLIEVPVFSKFGSTASMQIFRNAIYDATDLPNDLQTDGRVKTGSRLANLFMEQVSFTCGDCHLGHRGANNRYGDFRSSGCTACHMVYSPDGRSRSRDPNVNKLEPLNPDAIDDGETPHVRAHRILNVSRMQTNGVQIEGIPDWTCAGCHQGSNRSVMQYWGVRLDQNQDVRNHVQYPANPATFTNTANDTRLFDPAVGNNTFNGRNANQYLLKEDYDGDGRDDTPEDCHYQAGMGCIDCHGTNDIHGGDATDPNATQIISRMEQAIAIDCENCHGNADAYATTMVGTSYDGTVQDIAVDGKGHGLKHVVRESDGNYYLYSKLDGRKHFVPQTRDSVVDSGRKNPFTNEDVYDPLASYAMGRADADPSNGIGPLQKNTPPTGFRHGDSMSCATCHSSWANSCVGCHLKGEYNEGNNFSNITGERIVYRQTNADFTYQSVVPFQLGVDEHNRIAQVSTNTKVFYQYRDRARIFSRIFGFTDRNSDGNDPNKPYGSLGHNALMQHSIRGKVTSTREGPRYCVACHLTENSVAAGPKRDKYDAFRTAMAARNYGALDYAMLKVEIGQNPGNQLDSPVFVHMVAGLGSGLFLFDQDGKPVNPLDNNANRIGCDGVAPATAWDPARVSLDLDRIVDQDGTSHASNNHSMLDPGAGPNRRDGAADPGRPGPLGATLIQRLTDPDAGIVLDSWIDANGTLQGHASDFVPGS
jgi:hypothetical protein